MSPYSWNRIIRNVVDKFLALTIKILLYFLLDLYPYDPDLPGKMCSLTYLNFYHLFKTFITLIILYVFGICRLENYDHTLLIVIKDTNRSIFGAGMYVQYFIFKSSQDYVLYVH